MHVEFVHLHIFEKVESDSDTIYRILVSKPTRGLTVMILASYTQSFELPT